jgi:AcrR family transcriptional regulator
VTDPSASPLPRSLRPLRSIGKVEMLREPPAPRRRAELLAAATRLFGERGYRGATTNDLAAATGLSLGTVYSYFEDKRGCLLAAYDQVIDRARRRIVDHIPAVARPAEQIDAAIAALLLEIAADPAAARLALVVVQTAGPEGAARHRHTLAALAAQLRLRRESEGVAALPDGFEEVAVAAAASLLAESLPRAAAPRSPSIAGDLRALLLGPPADASSAAPALAGPGERPR